jgi:2'-5' RNA ligase
VRERVVEAKLPQEQGFLIDVRLGTSPGRVVRPPRLGAVTARTGRREPGYARTVRLFVAAIPPPALAEKLADAAAALAPPALRTTPTENVHVTIHFLGEVAPDAVPALTTALADVCAHHAPIELRLEAIAPGPPRRPRMLWGTAEASPAYEALVTAVSAAAAPYAPNARRARPGTPHLTLARLRGHARLNSWPDPQPLDDARFPVTELALVNSALGKYGPTYTTLTAFPLGGGQPAGSR